MGGGSPPGPGLPGGGGAWPGAGLPGTEGAGRPMIMDQMNFFEHF